MQEPSTRVTLSLVPWLNNSPRSRLCGLWRMQLDPVTDSQCPLSDLEPSVLTCGYRCGSRSVHSHRSGRRRIYRPEQCPSHRTPTMRSTRMPAYPRPEYRTPQTLTGYTIHSIRSLPVHIARMAPSSVSTDARSTPQTTCLQIHGHQSRSARALYQPGQRRVLGRLLKVPNRCPHPTDGAHDRRHPSSTRRLRISIIMTPTLPKVPLAIVSRRRVAPLPATAPRPLSAPVHWLPMTALITTPPAPYPAHRRPRTHCASAKISDSREARLIVRTAPVMAREAPRWDRQSRPKSRSKADAMTSRP